MNYPTLSGSTANFLQLISEISDRTSTAVDRAIPRTTDEMFAQSFAIYAAIVSDKNIQRIQYAKLICGHILGIVWAIALAVRSTIEQRTYTETALMLVRFIAGFLMDNNGVAIEQTVDNSTETVDYRQTKAEEVVNENAIDSTTETQTVQKIEAIASPIATVEAVNYRQSNVEKPTIASEKAGAVKPSRKSKAKRSTGFSNAGGGRSKSAAR